MRNRIGIPVAIALFVVVLGLGATRANAAEYGEYWFNTGGMYDAARITCATPSTAFSTSLTSKATLRLENPPNSQSSQISVGWKMAEGWSTPKSYWSRPVATSIFFFEQDQTLSNHSWGTSKVYELVHPPSNLPPEQARWEIWINHSREAGWFAYACDVNGQPMSWRNDRYHTGSRTSNNTLKNWQRTTLFEKRTASSGTWAPVYAAALELSPGGWINVQTYNDTWNFKFWSDNWTNP